MVGLIALLACLLPTSTGTISDEKIMPMAISFVPGYQSQAYRPPPQQLPYEEPPRDDSTDDAPFNEVAGPVNYGNKPGPGENAIAPEINPYPRLSYCVTTGKNLCFRS